MTLNICIYFEFNTYFVYIFHHVTHILMRNQISTMISITQTTNKTKI